VADEMKDQQEKYNIPLHLMLVFSFVVIGIVASGYVLYENRKAEFKKHEYRNLSAAADLKVREISNWRRERLGDAHVVQQNLPLILICTMIVLAGTATGLAWRRQQARFYQRQYEAELERKALTRYYEYLTKYANDIILMMDAD
jgi:hypothetical protein